MMHAMYQNPKHTSIQILHQIQLCQCQDNVTYLGRIASPPRQTPAILSNNTPEPGVHPSQWLPANKGEMRW